MADESVRNLLTKIANHELVLPEFQREFTWSKEQSRELIDSLLRGYPIGSLLFWKTSNVPALKNMPDFEPDGRVEVLLDGQQRLTALYMLTRDQIPPYYSQSDIGGGGDPRNLNFNLETRDLRYYKKIAMENNPRWLPVVDCFKVGDSAVNVRQVARAVVEDEISLFDLYDILHKNLTDLQAILDIKPPIMFVEEDADLRHALTVFDRVNSNGTPLSQADIALAHMCSAWPDTRRVFKSKLTELRDHGFNFDLTFLIRGINAVANGRAEYRILQTNTEDELRAAWSTLDRLLDYLINFLRDRAHIHSSEDLHTSNVLVPMLGYLAQNGLKFQGECERRKLLYWMYAAHYQTRYRGSVDQKLERDLGALESGTPADDLIAILREDHGDPTVSPDNLDTRGVGHPLYNMSVVIVRSKNGVDWSNGLAMEKPIGKSFAIERHHIFPRSVLEAAGYESGKNLIHRKRVNEIANRVPLTRAANMDIFYRRPREYLPVVQQKNPGNLERFMIPLDEALWEVERYEEFLRARREIIAREINEYMGRLISESGAEPEGREDRSLEVLLGEGESEKLEFKSTLRWNVHAKRNDKEIELAVLKTVAAFLNSEGGTLLIGVRDDGTAVGVQDDGFDNEDKMMLHLTNRVRDWIGAAYMRFVRQRCELVDGRKVLRVECHPAVTPAYLSYGNEQHLYIRTGPSTTSLPLSEVHEYVQDRFFGTGAR